MEIVVMSGASSGIGEATAVMLAKGGAKVVLGAPRLDRLEAFARRVAEAGGEVAYAHIDVRRRDDLTSSSPWRVTATAPLDVLVAEFTNCPVCFLRRKSSP